MPRPLQLGETAPYVVRDGAQRLGLRIALARKRRRWTLRELAAKAGLAYDTVRAVEAGRLQTGLGAYLVVLWAMGLEAEIDVLMDPDHDEEGKLLEITRSPQRVRHPVENYDEDF